MCADRAKEERFQILLMKTLDQEILPEEETEFDEMISVNEGYRNEYFSMKKIRDITMQMQFRTPPDEVWDRYWSGLYPRLERGWGWLLFSLGAMILLTWGGFSLVNSLIQNPGLTVIAKVGILLVIAGLAVLTVSVIREKWLLGKKDPYKEIRR